MSNENLKDKIAIVTGTRKAQKPRLPKSPQRRRVA